MDDHGFIRYGLSVLGDEDRVTILAQHLRETRSVEFSIEDAIAGVLS
jgi:hypothetical protein